MRKFWATLTCVGLSACSSPYYATVVEAIPGDARIAQSRPASGETSLNEGSPFDVTADSISGALLIEHQYKTRWGDDKDAILAQARRKASQLGISDVIAVEYTKKAVEPHGISDPRLVELLVGLLRGGQGPAPPTSRKPYVVCYEPPVSGETDQDIRATDDEEYGSIIRIQLVENGYYPALARKVGPEGSEKLDRLQKACPLIAGYYLGASFSAVGGINYVIGFAKNAGVELRLMDLETGKVVWRKDANAEVKLGYAFNLAPTSMLIRLPRATAISNAFVEFPAYQRKDGPAEM